MEMMENKTEFDRLQKKIQQLENQALKYKTAYSILSHAREEHDFETEVLEAATLGELNQRIKEFEKQGFVVGDISENKDGFFQNFICVLKRRF